MRRCATRSCRPSTCRRAASCIGFRTISWSIFDRGHLNQIVWNLVRNAWQHCQKKEGSIRVTARAGYMGDAVICELNDDGPGIPAERAARSSSRSSRRDPAAPGSGLYIARELADANGAALELLPKGPGAHFRLTLKRALARRERLAIPHAFHTARAMSRRVRGQPKVLVVDDEPDLLELLELTLSRMGLDTTRAESVDDALRLLDKRTVRSVPDRHAPARRRGPARGRAHQPEGPRRAGRRDHRVRQRRKRGRGAQGRRIRLSVEAGRARAAARAGQAGAEGAREAAAREHATSCSASRRRCSRCAA